MDIPDVQTQMGIRELLRYKAKFQGRGLIQRVLVGGTQLIEGDRLEPSLFLRDVADFELMTPPFRVTFWRMFNEDRCLHNSPLFLTPGLGIQTHAADTLHCWLLGPVEQFIATALWFLIGSSVYTPKIDYLSTEDCNRIALLRVKQKLWDHYKLKRSDPQWKRKGSEIWNLTIKMLGKKKHPKLNVKAAEAKGILEFVVKQLGEDVSKLEPIEMERGQLLLACGKSALKVDMALRNSGKIELEHSVRQQLLNDYTHHVTLFHRAGGLLKPKHHMMFHLIIDTARLGAPSLHATFRDESLNGVIAGIARSCHRNHFAEAVHFKFSALQVLAGPSAMHMH